MEQLSMDDLLYQFDEDIAKWEDVLGCFERCTVKAYIPKEAVSSLEQGSMHRIHNQYQYELWREYAGAIFSYLGPGDVWGKACDMLREFRDAEKPCPMEIRRSIKHPEWDYFKPSRVTEYLDSSIKLTKY